jgi:hypothetical protein
VNCGVVFLPCRLLHLRRAMSLIFYRDMNKEIDQADHKGSTVIKKLVYMDCNRTKKTGGNFVTLENVQKCGLPFHCKDHEMRGFKDATGKVIPVHLRLIYEFNGMTVTP